MWRWAAAVLAAVLWADPGGAAAPCDPDGTGRPCAVETGHYRIRLPNGAGPHPAVLYLYGSGGRSDRLAGAERFVQAFTERGYAVVIPAALTVRYRDGSRDSGWSLSGTAGRKRNERAFLGTVLRDAAARFDIDRRRVLMVGMSNGGFLTWEIACSDPGFAAAYAPVAAGRIGSLPRRCAGPVRLLHTHGRKDAVVGMDGRLWRAGGPVMYPPLRPLMARLARSNGCSEARLPERLAGFQRLGWRGCAPGSDAVLLVHDGGHTIPYAWYGAVLDWFENRPRSERPEAGGGASPRFVRPEADSGSRFKRPRN